MKRKFKILLAAAFAIFLASLFSLFIFKYDRTVAVVGDYKITAKQVEYRNKLNDIYYPNQKQRYGKDQLIQSYTYAQILKNNGHEITQKLLDEEESRIDSNTKAPETLKKIKDIFAKDRESYRKVFILPTYAERVIYFEHFMKSASAQEKSLRHVHNLITDLLSTPAELAFVAKERRLNYKKFHLSAERGIEFLESRKKKGDRPALIDLSASVPPEAVKKAVSQQFETETNQNIKFWIENVISQVKPGEFIPEPVDYGDHWLIVRYLKALGGKKFLLEAIFVPKDSYETWLAAEKAKVTINEF